MLLPGRHGEDPNAANDYRYSFQGQEHDDEIKGKGNSVNYKYRMHDPRIGRFFAVDPLAPKYPDLTPYQFSSNSPIYMVEIEGLEGEPYQAGAGVGGSTIYHDPGTCPTMFHDDNGDGVIGHPDGTPFQGVEGHEANSFVFKGVTYTARFDTDGSFFGYAHGEYGTENYKKYGYVNASIVNTYEIEYDAMDGGRDNDGYIIPHVYIKKDMTFVSSELKSDGNASSMLRIQMTYVYDFSPMKKFRRDITIEGNSDDWNEAWDFAGSYAKSDINCKWCSDVKAAAYGMSAGFSLMSMSVGRFKIINTAHIGKITTLDDIVMNPSLLIGKNSSQIENSLVRSGWVKGSYGKTGTGWAFRKGDNIIFYNKGGTHAGSYYGIRRGGKNGLNIKFVDKAYKATSDDKARIIRLY